MTDIATRPLVGNADRESRTVERLRTLFLQARDDKRARYDNWVRNYRLVHNRLGGSSSNWMPSPRDSEMYPGLASLVAWMTDQETDIDLIPAMDPASPTYEFISHVADDLNDVIATTWFVEDFDYQTKLGIWDALIYGTGIYKTGWDNQLANGYGNAIMRRTDPWAFYPDPNATSLDDAEYLVEARRMSFNEIERRFPDTAYKVRDSAGGGGLDQIDERPSSSAEQQRQPKANPGSIPQSGAWPGSSSGPGRFAMPSGDRLFDPLPGYVVYEFWLRDNEDRIEEYDALGPDYSEHRVHEKWRLVVLCNGRILLDCDADELFSHGKHPYERFVFDDIGEFYGVSLADHLAYPQIYVNRLLAALQHNAELTGNPIFIEPANSGLQRVGIINRPGQRLTVSGPAAMQNRPDWLQPPAMPQQVLDLVTFWIQRMENILGLSALQKGQTPTQRNAEGALNMVQEAAFVRVRSALSNLQACLQRCTGKVADIIIDNYNEPRVVAMVGADGEMTAKVLASDHFMVPNNDGTSPLAFILRVEVGANSPTSRSARSAQSERWFTLGLVDDEYVLQKNRVRNYQQVLKRLYDKRSKGVIGTPGQRQRAGRSS